MKILFCFLFFVLLPQSPGQEQSFNFVVWNVGQGSWSTYIERGHCFHFDMGGEKLSFKVIKLCQNKKNSIFLTHDDWDHVRFIRVFNKKSKSLCLYYPKKSRWRFLKKISKCSSLPSWLHIISQGNDQISRNAGSIVYLIKNKVLITGDAPMSQEKKWLHRLPKKISILLLGHHGSHTSTSIQLLRKIRPSMAIASARAKKYGHPHKKVVQKLQRFKVPLLTTESFGNLYFSL